MVRPMVHSSKHYVQNSIETITAGTVLTKTFIAAVAVDQKNDVFEVEEGASVKAVYVEEWWRAGSLTGTSGQAIIYKSEGDTSAPSAAEIAALGDWDNKKNILYTTMGLINDQDSLAMPIYKGWLKIPKGKQRFGLNDKLRMSVFVTAIDGQLCGFSTYKEYT